jgi:hypothetical protein
MKNATVRVRELAAWGLDNDEYRPTSWRGDPGLATAVLARRPACQSVCALVESKSNDLSRQFGEQATRTDLRLEMAGLDWYLGVVDVRHLLAFQRRILLDRESPAVSIPGADDWNGLINLCLGKIGQIHCEAVRSDSTLVMRSANPNFQVRFTSDTSTPIELHCGSPFFEVAQYRDRWFLRDGYHRAWQCLQNGVFYLPAVIVRARTLEELGAVHPWFFPESVLMSPSPPRVLDFLDGSLVIEYQRFPLIKTVRITVEETYSSQEEIA